jgi:hypothetical protein
MEDGPKNLIEFLYAFGFRLEEIERQARLRMAALYARTNDKPQKRRGPPPEMLESVKAKMRDYDPIELENMKVVQMAATFDVSTDTCRRAREAVLSEKK